MAAHSAPPSVLLVLQWIALVLAHASRAVEASVLIRVEARMVIKGQVLARQALFLFKALYLHATLFYLRAKLCYLTLKVIYIRGLFFGR